MGPKFRYQFPELDLNELMHELDMLGFEVGSNFWDNITSEIASDLYMNCLSIALEIDMEDIRPEELSGQVLLTAIDILSDQGKHHIKSIGNLRFLRYCKILWNMIGIDDFTMNDLYRPTADRIYIFLCGFVNLMRFKEDRWMTYKDEFYQIEEILDKVDKANEQIKQRKHDLANLRLKFNELSDEIQSRRIENQQLQEKMRNLHGEFLQNQQELKRLTQLDNDTQEALKDIEFRITTGNQDIQDLKDQVVQSPERLKNTMEELNRSLESDRRLIEQTSKRHNELQEKLNILRKVEKRLDKAKSFIEQIFQSIKEANNIKQNIKDIEHHIEKDNWTIEQSTEEERLLLQTVEQISLRIQNNQQHYESLIEEAQTLLDQEQQKYVQCQVLLEKQGNEAFTLERQAESLERDISNLRSNHEKTINMLTKQHSYLVEIFYKYRNELIQRLQLFCNYKNYSKIKTSESIFYNKEGRRDNIIMGRFTDENDENNSHLNRGECD
ncbi:Nuf2 family protein [Cryptosporidium muris RN66]|uniref:Nuf2 family protein n=1 Tax=Cryptosporidium muris (strain RN66) TaxID=441375 RepID=B6AIL9_CRYMR|nr:Nuf2 family protein [Cryptosporidium muris RN66]EEA08060.1 Nuf2 family protein [Cryptosporidium muris RN66]|eukprot:XP_002142409.1 Nuf2 family protein [Cryptosporidium muris RN66]